jgi:hypothetical protein
MSGRMNPSNGRPMAIAELRGSKWIWHLRIDDIGLYRWYLNGQAATHLRGCTRTLAESALNRFVANSLKSGGGLRIVEYSEETEVVGAGVAL